MALKNKVKQIRKALKINQNTFCKLIDITQSNLSLIEREKTGLSKRVLKGLKSIGIEKEQAEGKNPYDIKSIEKKIANIDIASLYSNPQQNNYNTEIENLLLRVELLELKVKELQGKK